MDKELRNRTLVAASVAKQNGFDNTYEALIELVREMEKSTVAENSFGPNLAVELIPPKNGGEIDLSLGLN